MSIYVRNCVIFVKNVAILIYCPILVANVGICVVVCAKEIICLCMGLESCAEKSY